MRCDLTFEMPPGRIASSTSSTGASRTASQLPNRSPQPHERDVAVAVVGRLREHGEDQLVEPHPVRRRRRDPVDLPQPVADPPDPRAAPAAHATAPHDSVARAPASAASASASRSRSSAGVPAHRLQAREQRPEERVAGATVEITRAARPGDLQRLRAARERAVGAERHDDQVHALARQRLGRRRRVVLAGEQPRLGCVGLDQQAAGNVRPDGGDGVLGPGPAVEPQVGVEADGPAELERTRSRSVARPLGERQLRAHERVGRERQRLARLDGLVDALPERLDRGADALPVDRELRLALRAHRRERDRRLPGLVEREEARVDALAAQTREQATAPTGPGRPRRRARRCRRRGRR